MTAPQTPVEQLPAPLDDVDEDESNWVKNAAEWAGILLLALVAAFIIKTFLLQAFFIPSESMDPTLKIGDRVLVNKLSYKLHDIHRGDIVVFERPPAEKGGDPAIKDLIKRVIALPGEKVEGRDGHIYIDDKQLNEPYLSGGVVTGAFPSQVVPEGSYWVMGDNRPRSKDSRIFGPIGEDLIVGRAFIRVWPIPKLHLL